MAVSKRIRRLSFREAEAYRTRLREDQHRRDRLRQEKLRLFRRDSRRVDGIEGVLVLVLIFGFFALVFWLAVSDFVPAAY